VVACEKHCDAIATALLEGGMDTGGGVVKGWPWGNGSYTNTVMALLHWKGMGKRLSPEKLGGNIYWSIYCILGHFSTKTKVADQ